MIGHKLNGATIVAAVQDVNRRGETVIVAEVAERPELGLRHKEYVTALVRSDDPTPTEWHAGNYFATPLAATDSNDARARAFADMLRRSGWAVEVSA